MTNVTIINKIQKITCQTDYGDLITAGSLDDGFEGERATTPGRRAHGSGSTAANGARCSKWTVSRTAVTKRLPRARADCTQKHLDGINRAAHVNCVHVEIITRKRRIVCCGALAATRRKLASNVVRFDRFSFLTGSVERPRPVRPPL